jgi:hypothetical protein
MCHDLKCKYYNLTIFLWKQALTRLDFLVFFYIQNLPILLHFHIISEYLKKIYLWSLKYFQWQYCHLISNMIGKVSNMSQYNEYDIGFVKTIPWSSPFWEDDSYLTIQEILCLLFKLKVYYQAHISQLLDTMLKDLYFYNIHTYDMKYNQPCKPEISNFHNIFWPNQAITSCQIPMNIAVPLQVCHSFTDLWITNSSGTSTANNHFQLKWLLRLYMMNEVNHLM